MRKIIVLIIIGCLAGCATGEKMSRLKEGMTKTEVIDVLGDPDGFQRSGDYEAMKYNHRLVTGWAWDRADYNVILKEGKVVEYGQGQVRVKEMNSILFLVPLR